jgi:predicted kinase
MSYIVHINGHPGVGKLTVGELLRERLGARLLDNHSVYNVALSLTDFKSDIYFDTLRAVREIAYARILDLPKDVPVVLTNAHFQGSEWGEQSWDLAIDLAARRGVPHLAVVLSCSIQEIERRIQGESRRGKRKPRSLDVFKPGSGSRPLIDRGEHVMRLETTELKAEETGDNVKCCGWRSFVHDVTVAAEESVSR